MSITYIPFSVENGRQVYEVYEEDADGVLHFLARGTDEQINRKLSDYCEEL